MKKTNPLLLLRTAFSCALLTCAFVLLSVDNANAQVAATTANPEASTAQKFGVTAYQLGTFERSEVISVLDQNLANMRPLMQHGNPSLENQLKVAFYSKVRQDVKVWNIAAEISLLKSLSAAMNEFGGSKAQMVSLYNQTVAQLD